MVKHLEGVVLGGDLSDEVRADEGNLLHDILSYTGDIGKEEEGEETSSGTKAGTHGSAIRAMLAKMYEQRPDVLDSKVQKGVEGIGEELV